MDEVYREVTRHGFSRSLASLITAMLRRRGDADAGALLVKVNRLDGSAALFARVTSFSGGTEWQRSSGEAWLPDADIEQRLESEIRFDPDSGQLVTGSFMDYTLPRADDMSNIDVVSDPVPTKTNPLGCKGAGEAGTVGAVPAVMNAVVDALSPLGVRHVDMPATPERVWRAMQEAKSAAA